MRFRTLRHPQHKRKIIHKENAWKNQCKPLEHAVVLHRDRWAIKYGHDVRWGGLTLFATGFCDAAESDADPDAKHPLIKETALVVKKVLVFFQLLVLHSRILHSLGGLSHTLPAQSTRPSTLGSLCSGPSHAPRCSPRRFGVCAHRHDSRASIFPREEASLYLPHQGTSAPCRPHAPSSHGLRFAAHYSCSPF
jgi:hypothetical protein